MRSAKWALPVAVIALAFACALAPAQALAHGGNPNYRSEINSFQPPLPSDVSIEVLDYDSYLQLIDQDGHEVMLYGYDGEPYARIEKDGTVQVNERSPATYLNDSRFAEETVPSSADAKAAPQWKTVDSSGTFIWHDHRMHYMSRSLPPSVKDKSQKTKIFNYEIPMSIDGKKTVLHGTLWWVGSTGTSKLPFVIAAIVIVLGGGGLVLWIRRRRDRDDGDDAGTDAGGPDQRRPPEPVGEAW
jgi:LPXTG-motif cell wall-anchored protein